MEMKFALGNLLGEPQTEEEKLNEILASFEGQIPPRLTIALNGEGEADYLCVSANSWVVLSQNVSDVMRNFLQSTLQNHPEWSTRAVVKKVDRVLGRRRGRRRRSRWTSASNQALVVSSKSFKVFGKFYDSSTGGNRTVQIGCLPYSLWVDLKVTYIKAKKEEDV